MLINHVQQLCEGQSVTKIEKNPGRGLTNIKVHLSNGAWLLIEPNAVTDANGHIQLNGVKLLTSEMIRKIVNRPPD